ncbi:loader and inhibitor of G40P protein [Aneurinibacillus soli]|uniref:Loader and inhibitor of phage G40P n=1 Tax=Aneurinibacillus soli TaxID=1500254 RepID=A0A0U5B9D5_9BACL|nr:replicative helicase loader/inhibitor [Aneurinibacillus soli]PYE64249.1 loader and inhibitor of G40P protein [Aneurinibacillus soli]BAU28198.1 Loader and inhibitor of phage G40P [Aneurinibacillus soli]
MTLEQTVDVLEKIAAAYHSFEVTEKRIILWHEFLEPHDMELVNKNLRRHIESKPFPPAISDLVKPDEDYEREYVPLGEIDLLGE